MGAIDLHEVPRSVRLLRWALPVQRVNIRGYAPDTPEGRTYANYVCVLRSHESLSSCSEHLKSLGTLSHWPDSFDTT